MRSSMAYFAGVGTVVVAIATGLGGGLLIANIVSPHSPKDMPNAEMTKLERRMSSQPIPAANAPAEPVPYLATTQPPQAQPQIEAANPAPAAARPAKLAAVADTAAKPPEAPASQPAAQAAQAAPQEQAAAPENALAKARDADMKRVAQKRRAERRQQQWADQRRYQLRKDEEPRDVERNATGERNVREEPEPRQFIERPVRLDFPRIRLFGPSDDDQ
jgi:hypothetical protein